MFKTSGRASFLIILFQFLQYYVLVALSGDAFSTALLLRLRHQRRRLHKKNPLHSKNVWQLLGVLLCFVAQILLLTFLTGSK